MEERLPNFFEHLNQAMKNDISNVYNKILDLMENIPYNFFFSKGVCFQITFKDDYALLKYDSTHIELINGKDVLYNRNLISKVLDRITDELVDCMPYNHKELFDYKVNPNGSITIKFEPILD